MLARYEFIDAEKATTNSAGTPRYSIKRMCRWWKVSASGFSAWLARPAAAAARRRAELQPLVGQAFTDSDGRSGSRRVPAQLARGGRPVHADVVRDLMRELGLVACPPRRSRRGTTRPAAKRADIPDLVHRGFTAAAPGQKMVGDVTYIPTWEGWRYLALVIGCYSRKIVGGSMEDDDKTPLIADAIRMAARNLPLSADPVFHSDGGANYPSDDVAKTLEDLGIRQSVGRTGICYDHRLSESTNGAVKGELVNREEYPTRACATQRVAQYIELFYNSRRFPSALGYRTPQEVLNEYYRNQEAA